jgi:hypothetical protein
MLFFIAYNLSDILTVVYRLNKHTFQGRRVWEVWVFSSLQELHPGDGCRCSPDVVQ